MRHVHYDIDKIERDLRAMFANTPGEIIHPRPGVVDAFRNGVDIEVAFARWFFTGLMAGVEPQDQLEAFISLVSTSIMNRVRAVGSNEGQEPVVDFVMNGIIATVDFAFTRDQTEGPSEHSIPVKSVPSGRA